MTIETCPKCGARAAPRARYCPDCYLVFPTQPFGGARSRRSKSGSGGRARTFAAFLFVAIVAAWFVQIDTNDWSAQPGSFQARARDMKRYLIAAVLPAPGRSKGESVARGDVRQTQDGCTISQRVTNSRAEPVSSVILTFSFMGTDGTAVGQPVSATVNEALPAGASRDFTFHVPCPEMFAGAQVQSAGEGIELLASARGAQAAAGDRLKWLLENDNRLPCAFGASCEVVIRFDTGDVANYLIERRSNGRTRFFAVDQRGTDLLSAANRAELVVRAAGGGTQSIPIRRRDDERWSITAENAARRSTSNREGPQG